MGEVVSSNVLAMLSQGALILTSTERAARVVQHSWDRLQLDRKLTTWQPANVLSWRSWTHSLWKRLLLRGATTDLLLTPLQEHRVWRAVLASDTSSTVRSLDSLADFVSAAWQRLCAYEGQQRFHQSTEYLHGDAQRFAVWVKAFEERCQRELLLSAALLEAKLTTYLSAEDLGTAIHGVMLLGFDRLTPAQTTLLAAVHSHEIGTTLAAEESVPNHSVVLAASDDSEELRGCARWIQNRLRNSPQARIALVVSDLKHETAKIDSVLREHLASQLENIAAHAERAPYEFSLGRPLLHEPMIQIARNLLHWAAKPLPLEDISRLLLSPYFAFCAEEAAARAEFDVTSFRQHLRLRPEATIASVNRDLQRTSEKGLQLPTLNRVVEGMAKAQEQSDLQARGFGDWSEWMRGWLSRASWAERAYSSSNHEYQLRERWENALDELATLDFAAEMIAFDEALSTLERLLRETIFAPEYRDAPVQILGPLEATGQHFDAVWVLRTGEMTWLPTASASPLLTWSLQVELGMPGTDTERERSLAHHLTKRLAASAPDVVFSYAHTLLPHGHQRAATAVRDLQLQCSAMSDFVSDETPRLPVPLENVSDLVNISLLPDAVHRGGVRLLELQAACGFRAFAEMRLGASEPRRRSIGLSAMERGNAVHHALELFWSQVGSQQELRTMNESQREEIILRAVSHSLRHARQQQPDRWDLAYLETQQIRLALLLRDWIALELQRPDFTVLAQEHQQEVSIGPLRLSLRVDRVDLVDGQRIILDYKTGHASPSQWLGHRPDQPQVPLYAILATEAAAQADASHSPLGAVGFAQVRPGREMQLRGLEATPGMLSKPTSRQRAAVMEADSFQGQVERWQGILERLAAEFAEGSARVHPKRYPTTCERCGQRSLCRIDTSSFDENFQFEGADEDDSGDDYVV